MREWLTDWSRALLQVWNRQMHLPLPEKLKNRVKKSAGSREMAAFALLGTLCSLIIFLFAVLCSAIFNHLVGALIMAVCSWLFWLFHDHGRGDGLISKCLAGFLPVGEIPFLIVVPVFLLIMKFAALTALFFYGRGLMVTMVFGGMFAMEALLIKEAEFSPPVMDVSAGAMQKYWITLALLLLLNMFGSLAGSAFGALFFAAWWRYAGIKMKNSANPVDRIRFSGAVCAWLMLLAGLLAI